MSEHQLIPYASALSRPRCTLEPVNCTTVHGTRVNLATQVRSSVERLAANRQFLPARPDVGSSSVRPRGMYVTLSARCCCSSPSHAKGSGASRPRVAQETPKMPGHACWTAHAPTLSKKKKDTRSVERECI